MSNKIFRLTLKEVEYIAFSLAQETLSFNEPIPDFFTRYPNRLESCISVPFQTFDKKDLYKSLYAKASVIFYLMNKNHPFQNGNKRLAMTTLFVFLAMNKKWLKVDVQELYNFAVWVAASPTIAKEEVINTIQKFIKRYVVDQEIKN
ncbi:MAG: type II toxin-antitoxin system death-on-curing family toxin [Candidatus Omnitrophota bacterium]